MRILKWTQQQILMNYYTVMYITHANFKCSTYIGTFEFISIYKRDVHGKDAIVLSIKNLTWENHQTPAHNGWLMTVKLYHKTPRWNVSRWIHTGSFVPTQQDDMPTSSIGSLGIIHVIPILWMLDYCFQSQLPCMSVSLIAGSRTTCQCFKICYYRSQQ